MGKLGKVRATLRKLTAGMIDVTAITELWVADVLESLSKEKGTTKIGSLISNDGEAYKIGQYTEEATRNWLEGLTGKDSPFSKFVYQLKSGGNYGHNTVFTGGKFNITTNPKDPICVIHLNVWAPATIGYAKKRIHEAREILSHELTHLAQYVYNKEMLGKSGASNAFDNPDAYFNNPVEVRAFARSVYEQIKELANSTGAHLQDILDRNKLYLHLKQYMTDKNIKLLTKLVYTELNKSKLNDVKAVLIKLNGLVGAGTVEDMVRKLHYNSEDFSGGDILDRIWKYDFYKFENVPIDKLDFGSYDIDEDMVQEYAEKIKNKGDYPPLVVDPEYSKWDIIDGNHRAEALMMLGAKYVKCYVGVKQ